MTRGFEEGFQRTTLRDFWGKLTSVTGEMRSGNSGAYAVALYNFEELEVVHATEVYTSPIGQIEVPVSTKARSKMGYFGASVDRVINFGLPLDAPQEQVKTQGYIIGKMLHMKLTGGHSIPSKDDVTGEWGEKPTDCWELIEIRGEGPPAPAPAPAATVAQPPVPPPTQAGAVPAVDAIAQALNLLDGKTEQAWHQAVFVDPIIKADTEVIQTIINRQFLTGLEGAKKVTKDADGTYHVVPLPAA